MKIFARSLWRLLPQPVRHGLTAATMRSYLRSMAMFDNHMDRKYGVDTSAIHEVNDAKRRQTVGGDPAKTKSYYYSNLLALRRYLAPTGDDVVMDLGCGTGRVLFVFANSGARRVRGADFYKGAYEACKSNIARFRGDRGKIVVEQADCARLEFKDETIFYLFNPFGAATLKAVLENIHRSWRENPRRIRIVFFETEDRTLLDNAEWLTLKRDMGRLKRGLLVYETQDNVREVQARDDHS